MAKLYPAANKAKRARLRTLAHLVEELDGFLTNPEGLNQHRLLRIEAAFRAGFGDVIRTALEESSLEDPQTQWQLLLPLLTEAENPPPNAPKPPPGRAPRGSRPPHAFVPRAPATCRRDCAPGFDLPQA